MDRIKNMFRAIRVFLSTLFAMIQWLAEPKNRQSIDKVLKAATEFAVRYVQFYRDNIASLTRLAAAICAAVHSTQATAEMLKAEVGEAKKSLEQNFKTAQKDLNKIFSTKPVKRGRKAKPHAPAKPKKTVHEIYSARVANAAKARAAKAARCVTNGAIAETATTSRGGVVEIPADRMFD
jgi:hypothetical protein